MPNSLTVEGGDTLISGVPRLHTMFGQLAAGSASDTKMDTNEYRQAVGRIVARAASSATQEAEDYWRYGFDLVLSGHAKIVHQMREEILAVPTKAVSTVETIRRMAEEAGCDAVVLRDLEALSQELVRKLAYRASRWVTVEDLEDLAAESLVPSNETLQAVRDGLPFPQGWLEEDVKPF